MRGAEGMARGDAVQRLLGIMARLRDPGEGCPWDREQTFASIVPHTLEEAYEVADAIERDALDELPDELGDLLFQIVFYAQLGRERGLFDSDRIATAVADKIVRRHPHVFGGEQIADAQAQTRSWESTKAAERAAWSTEGPASALDHVPRALPALTRSAKLQSRAARVGFDWPVWAPVFAKIHEELEELEAEVRAGVPDAAAVEEEMGDVLLACTNLARHLRVDPEQALRRGNAKFERRFRGLEAHLRDQGKDPAAADFDTLEAAYQAVKAKESGPT